MSEQISSTPSRSGSIGRILLAISLVVLAALGGLGIWQNRTIDRKTQEIAALQSEKAGFISARDSLDGYISQVEGTIDEVGTKLRDVREKQVAISSLVAAAERDQSKKSVILDDIAALEMQLAQDRRDIDDLKERMNKSAFRIRSLEKMVAGLQKEIEQNQVVIAELKAGIESRELTLGHTRDSLSFSQKVLRNTESKLHETEQVLIDTRNTAYYVIGNSRELEQRNVIERVGFISKKPALTSEFDSSAFSRIDVTRVADFSVNCKAGDIRVVPPRALGSYRVEQIEDNRSVLKVLDREQFWKVPYLAIVVK